MVGDRHHDIEGAKMNNIRAIAAEYGFGNKEEYENSVFVAQKPTDIYDYVINNR